MKSLWLNGSIKRLILFVVLAFCLSIPSMIWCAGYQEEKLFDKNFYSTEELRKKIETHTNEIQVLDDQIIAYETDIDWLVLKINQLEDSGRTAPAELKESIVQKEKKIVTLLKTKNRLEYLVQYYSANANMTKEKTLEDIVKFKKEPMQEKESTIKVEKISAVKTEPTSQTKIDDPDVFEGISKTQLQTSINKAGLNDWVEIVGTGTCLRLETTLPILFPTGSATVADEYKSFFKKLADFLKPYDVKILVNGYADTVPINNKKYPSNFELGATRAANIVHQFVGYGLKPSIFRIESTGKYRFEAKEASKQKTFERRAEVTVIFSG